MIICRPLLEVFKEVEEIRKTRGKRSLLYAVLSLACVATLCGYKSYSAIAEWGGGYGGWLVRQLGFKTGKTPSVGALFNLFSRLEWEDLEVKLSHWVRESLFTQCPPGQVPGLSFDGSLRGSRRQGAGESHILSVFCHYLGMTLFR